MNIDKKWIKQNITKSTEIKTIILNNRIEKRRQCKEKKKSKMDKKRGRGRGTKRKQEY